MTEHTALPDNMSLVNVGLGQLQWWMDEYIDGKRKGHFVGPAFTCRPYLSFIQTACNCHAESQKALRELLKWAYWATPQIDSKGPWSEILDAEEAIRKVEKTP